LRTGRADTDVTRFARNALILDVDVVITHGKVETGSGAQSDVAAAGCVVSERKITVGRVAGAGCVALERANTVGSIVIAGCVVNERLITAGRVVGFRSIPTNRGPTAMESLVTVLLLRAECPPVSAWFQPTAIFLRGFFLDKNRREPCTLSHEQI
jgi:hypothetical protein